MSSIPLLCITPETGMVVRYVQRQTLRVDSKVEETHRAKLDEPTMRTMGTEACRALLEKFRRTPDRV